MKVTTDSGRVYEVDVERGFWSRSPSFRTNRLWSLKAGTEKVWPWDKPEVWEDRLPNVGEYLFVQSRDEWYVSNKVVSIED